MPTPTDTPGAEQDAPSDEGGAPSGDATPAGANPQQVLQDGDSGQPPAFSLSAPAAQDDPLVRLEAVIQRVGSLPELSMHISVVGEHLESVSVEDAVFGLDQLIRRSLTGDLHAPNALLGAVLWLMRQSVEAERDPRANRYDHISALYRVASEQRRELVMTFLFDLPAHKTAKILRQNVARLLKKDLTLGERKQLARGNNRQHLEALIHDSDPQVIEKLCNNPSIREQDILTIVTRRPNKPEILRTIALSERWMVRYTVRHALLLNPYAFTGISIKLLPFLRGTDIRKVSLAGDLHPLMAQYAKQLLALRSTRYLKP